MGLFSAKSSGADLDWPAWFQQRAGETGDPDLKRFYTAGSVWPDAPIRDVPMVAMDLETTGLDHRRHAIVSIGLVPFTLARIQFRDRMYRVVRPPRPLNEESIRFHGITHSEIADAPDLNVILPQVLEAMAGRVVVVHYRGIERPFMDTAVKARRGEGLRFPVIDTMELEARRHRQSFWSQLRRFAGQPPLSIRLNDSRARYHLPAYQAHHALTDALATAELLQAQLAAWYSPDTPVSELWS